MDNMPIGPANARIPRESVLTPWQAPAARPPKPVISAADRLAQQAARRRQEEAERKANAIPFGRLGLTKFRSNRTQPPKPLESQRRLFDRVIPEPQTISLLHSAGVRRPTVLLNHMSPMQVMAAGGSWLMMQHRAAIIPESAISVVDGRGSITINIPRLPTISTDEEFEDKIDPECGTQLPPDGSICLSGTLILKNPETVTSWTQLSVRYLGVAIIPEPDDWTGMRVHGAFPLANNLDRAVIDIQDHVLGGQTYGHVPATRSMAGLTVPDMMRILPHQRTALFEVQVWRTSMEAATVRTIRRIF